MILKHVNTLCALFLASCTESQNLLGKHYTETESGKQWQLN